MKKLFKALIITMLVVASCLCLFACNTDDGEQSAKGIVYKKYKGEDFYTVYDYVDDGVTTSLNITAKDGIEIGRIATGAFDGSSLTEIIVPNTVTEIGAGAFKNMKKLESLTLPFIGKTAVADGFINESAPSDDKSVDASRTISYLFGTEEYDMGIKITNNYNADKNTTCYLPQTLTKIVLNPKEDYVVPMYAFSGFVNLRTVELSDKVTAIGDGAFKGCMTLKNIELPASVTAIGKNAFDSCKMLDTALLLSGATGVESLGNFAFANTKFASITLPQSVQTIGESCFVNAELQTITLSKNLISIGKEAFSGCKYLTTVNSTTVTASKVTVGVFAFVDCKKLTNSGIDLSKFDCGANCFMDSGVTIA